MAELSKKTIAYGCIAIHFWLGCLYDWNMVVIPVEVHPIGKSFGWTNKLKFLTYLNALLQSFFYTVCFLNDIYGNPELVVKEENKKFLRKLKDILFPALAFPLAMFVGLTFWALYAVDRELVFPKAIDPYFPWWLNHVMHTHIMIFICAEMYISYRNYPPREKGMGILGGWMLLYLVWVHVIHAYADFWVYPVLDVLNFPLRVFFFASLFAMSGGLYIMGEKINNKIWAEQIEAEAKSQ